MLLDLPALLTINSHYVGVSPEYHYGAVLFTVKAALFFDGTTTLFDGIWPQDEIKNQRSKP